MQLSMNVPIELPSGISKDIQGLPCLKQMVGLPLFSPFDFSYQVVIMALLRVQLAPCSRMTCLIKGKPF